MKSNKIRASVVIFFLGFASAMALEVLDKGTRFATAFWAENSADLPLYHANLIQWSCLGGPQQQLMNSTNVNIHDAQSFNHTSVKSPEKCLNYVVTNSLADRNKTCQRDLSKTCFWGFPQLAERGKPPSLIVRRPSFSQESGVNFEVQVTAK